MLTAFAPIVAPCVAQQPVAVSSGPADRELAADAFEIALTKGFFLRARERMIYLDDHDTAGDPHGWRVHRFVSNQGRPIRIRLPASTRIFIWPMGQGPRPIDSTCRQGAFWGRIPASAGFNAMPADATRLYHLWRRSVAARPFVHPSLDRFARASIDACVARMSARPAQ